MSASKRPIAIVFITAVAVVWLLVTGRPIGAATAYVIVALVTYMMTATDRQDAARVALWASVWPIYVPFIVTAMFGRFMPDEDQKCDLCGGSGYDESGHACPHITDQVVSVRSVIAIVLMALIVFPVVVLSS